MNLYDLYTPLHLKEREEIILFVRNLRFHRTLDNSPPKKEVKKRVKKTVLKALNLDPEQMELFLQLLENENGKGDS